MFAIFFRESNKPVLKTYSRQPLYRKEATFSNQVEETYDDISNNITHDSLEVNWPEPDNNIDQHQLLVEEDPNDTLSGLTGKRVVDINYVLKWAFSLERHRIYCTSSQIEFCFEKKNGCEKTWQFHNEPNETLNTSFVWATVSAGSYFSQTEQILSVMDIPAMSFQSFQKIENSLGDTWSETLTLKIEEAGRKEKEIAIKKGNVTETGVPYITVYVDGGWPKRSYGHNYNSASGMVCSILCYLISVDYTFLW